MSPSAGLESGGGARAGDLLSTLDRTIRKGEVEAVREARRVYVRMHGPEYLSDDELLRQAIIRGGRP